MNSDGISLRFLGAAQNILLGIIQSSDLTTFNSHLTEALADLEQFSLVFLPNSALIQIHRLVQSVIKYQMTTDELGKHKYLVYKVGLSAFAQFDHMLWTTCRNYEGEIVAIISEIAEVKSKYSARLIERVGTYFGMDGKASETAPLLSRACNVLEIVKGRQNSDTLRTMGNLAAYWSLEKVKDVAEMEKVLKARSRILGDEHSDTLWTIGNLAVSYRSLGKVKEAVKMQEKVLDVRRSILGEEHPDTVWTMENLAASYFSFPKVKQC